MSKEKRFNHEVQAVAFLADPATGSINGEMALMAAIAVVGRRARSPSGRRDAAPPKSFDKSRGADTVSWRRWLSRAG